MTSPLRLLVVEDSQDDAFILVLQLERAGFRTKYQQVASRHEMEKALVEQPWDLIISDHLLPGFSSFEALELAKKHQPDIPFIVVSGMIGEEAAVAVMKAGANDYVMKNNLARLVPSIERELREAESHRARKRAEDAAQTVRAYLASIVESSEDAIIGKALDGTILSWNAGAEAIYGYKAEEIKGQSVSILFPPNHPEEQPAQLYEKIRAGGRIERLETVRVRKNGSPVYISLSLSPIRDAEGKVIGVSAIERDITTRKREEEVRLKLIQELTDALNNIKTLTGLLPICASCKKIRDDRGYWQMVELYISEHTGAEFTHGICPECLTRLYPEYKPAR